MSTAPAGLNSIQLSSIKLSRVGRCDHALKLINAICTAGRPSYSHHYAYSLAHVKVAVCMPQNSGVVFVAARRFPSVGWYNIDSV